ncbi:MAG: hypothetical protein BWY71_00622 [Planctomycetes bacterium ADurb.Bin412]|nr:MAG: hypothetical protein BWY71_00622 [Planctomycetes bacterium ADurb.Bin412]
MVIPVEIPADIHILAEVAQHVSQQSLRGGLGTKVLADLKIIQNESAFTTVIDSDAQAGIISEGGCDRTGRRFVGGILILPESVREKLSIIGIIHQPAGRHPRKNGVGLGPDVLGIDEAGLERIDRAAFRGQRDISGGIRTAGKDFRREKQDHRAGLHACHQVVEGGLAAGGCWMTADQDEFGFGLGYTGKCVTGNPFALQPGGKFGILAPEHHVPRDRGHVRGIRHVKKGIAAGGGGAVGKARPQAIRTGRPVGGDGFAIDRQRQGRLGTGGYMQGGLPAGDSGIVRIKNLDVDRIISRCQYILVGENHIQGDLGPAVQM